MDIVSYTFASTNYDQNKPLFIDPTSPARSLSATQTQTLVRQLVGGLQEHGLGKESGDCVCVVSFNDINYTALYLGIIGSGCIFTGANPGYTARELSHHVRITGAKCILVEPKALPSAMQAAAECKIPNSSIFVLKFRDDDVPDGYKSWKQLLDKGEKEWVKVEDPDDRPAAYVSTSGTSGLPKAAIITHSYFTSQAAFQESTTPAANKVSQLIAIPPFHVFTMPLQHGLPLRAGAPTYIMSRFEENGFLNAVDAFSITHTAIVPPIMMALSKASKEKLKSLRCVFVAGSCATDGMQQQLYSKLSLEARIVQVYGMTEVGWATCWSKSNRDASGSVGQPLPAVKLRIINAAGKQVITDDISGEVQIYCPTLMKGYLGNETATVEAFTSDGWIRTGDIGYSKDGNWYIIDRTKDLLKVRGWQVSPAEIEAALLEHSNIIDAGVIGMPARDGSGEVPVAYAVRSGRGQLNEAEVKRFLGDRLARYKNVDEVHFVEKIPRNSTGKILRRVLRDNRDSKEPGPDQLAAREYTFALKHLNENQKRKRSQDSLEEGTIVTTNGRSDTLLSTQAIDDLSETTMLTLDKAKVATPAKKSKKGKYCSTSPFTYWWQTRRRSKEG